jgi:copper(I)-binding protein
MVDGLSELGSGGDEERSDLVVVVVLVDEIDHVPAVDHESIREEADVGAGGECLRRTRGDHEPVGARRVVLGQGGGDRKGGHHREGAHGGERSGHASHRNVTVMRTWLVLAALAAVVLAACGGAALSSGPKIEVIAARSPLPASPDVGAVYLTIKNESSRPDVLLSATSNVATQTMLHREVVTGAIEEMVPSGPVTIGPGQSLVLSPDGYHLMLMNLERHLAVGQEIQVTLVFRRAGRIVVNVPVVPLLSGDTTGATMAPGMHMP